MEWRAIPGYEGLYEASDEGLVRSLPRTVDRGTSTYTVRGGLLKPHVHKGYLQVRLSKAGRVRTWRVHQLVMLAFVGPPPPGMEVCHFDGDKQNNVRTNLRYGTPSDNIADRLRLGEHHYQRRQACSKGHEYTEENTRVRVRKVNGKTRRSRVCRTCEQRTDKIKEVANAG